MAKILVMGLSGLLAIFTGRLIIQEFGTEAYAQYGLLSTLPSLLPFADLGIAAVVINAVASSKSPSSDAYVRRVIVTAFRILICSGGILLLLALSITALNWWPVIFGDGLLPEGPMASLLCVAVFAAALPLAVGQRILVGLGRTTTQIAAQSVVAPFMFCSIGALVLLNVPAGGYLSVLSYMGMALVSVICLLLAAKALRPQMRLAIRELPFRKQFPGVPVISMAWPMLVQMVALPIAMQTDRLLLSHLTTGNELAEYNLSAQLFGMALQTIAAAGMALWPIFAKARSEAQIQSPVGPTLWFLAGGCIIAVGLAVLAPFLARFMSGGAIVLDPWLIWGFVGFVALQAAKYPVGMYMTDLRGLRFQVAPVILMIPISLGLSWWLIHYIGAGGAILGSAVAVGLCQVIPNLWYVQWDLKRRRADLNSPVVLGDKGS